MASNQSQQIVVREANGRRRRVVKKHHCTCSNSPKGIDRFNCILSFSLQRTSFKCYMDSKNYAGVVRVRNIRFTIKHKADPPVGFLIFLQDSNLTT